MFFGPWIIERKSHCHQNLYWNSQPSNKGEKKNKIKLNGLLQIPLHDIVTVIIWVMKSRPPPFQPSFKMRIHYIISTIFFRFQCIFRLEFLIYGYCLIETPIFRWWQIDAIFRQLPLLNRTKLCERVDTRTEGEKKQYKRDPLNISGVCTYPFFHILPLLPSCLFAFRR